MATAAYVGTGVAASQVQTLEGLLAGVRALVPRQGAALHEVARDIRTISIRYCTLRINTCAHA